MKIFGYNRNAAPTKIYRPACPTSVRQAQGGRVTRANSKKVAPTRPEVPLPFPYIVEALFSDGDGSATIKMSPQNFSQGCSPSQLRGRHDKKPRQVQEPPKGRARPLGIRHRN